MVFPFRAAAPFPPTPFLPPRDKMAFPDGKAIVRKYGAIKKLPTGSFFIYLPFSETPERNFSHLSKT